MERIVALQMARAIAANAVVLFHISEGSARFLGTGNGGPAAYGMGGVDAFFVISGFVMATMIREQTNPLGFLYRRASRIYPMYWLATALLIAVCLTFPNATSTAIGDAARVASSLLLIPESQGPILAVGWTLVHEMYFYLVFVLILAVRCPLIIGCGIWLAVIIVGRQFLGADMTAEQPALRIALSPMTLEFIAGCLIGMAYRATRMPGASIAWGSLAIMVAALIALGPSGADLRTANNLDELRVVLLGIPSVVFVYALVATYRGTRRAIPAIFVRLGDWSYSTYLLHVFVISAVARLLAASLEEGTLAVIALVLFATILANVAGAVAYTLFERPMLRVAAELPRLLLSARSALGHHIPRIQSVRD